MSAETFWIRLGVDYDRVWWLRRERRFVKNAFPDLLRHVRKESPRKGQVAWRGIDDLAYVLRYEEDEIWALARMLECAQMVSDDDPVPAIEIKDGILTIVKWCEFQSPDASRKKAYRNESPDIDNMSGHIEESLDLHEKSETNELCPESPVVRDKGTSEQENNSLRESNTCEVKPTPVDWQEPWREFCEIYPKRAKGDGKADALVKFKAYIKSGQDPGEILAGARAYRKSCDDSETTGTEYVAMKSTWLNKKRWLDDYGPVVPKNRNGALNGTHKQTGQEITDGALAILARRGISGEIRPPSSGGR